MMRYLRRFVVCLRCWAQMEASSDDGKFGDEILGGAQATADGT